MSKNNIKYPIKYTVQLNDQDLIELREDIKKLSKKRYRRLLKPRRIETVSSILLVIASTILLLQEFFYYAEMNFDEVNTQKVTVAIGLIVFGLTYLVFSKFNILETLTHRFSMNLTDRVLKRSSMGNEGKKYYEFYPEYFAVNGKKYAYRDIQEIEAIDSSKLLISMDGIFPKMLVVFMEREYREVIPKLLKAKSTKISTRS